MIRFNVGGQYLELPSGFSVEFKKSNILFAFDKIECERSVSFNIPATANNDRVFGIAKWNATYGIGMRKRFDAQMQSGVVVKDGYLYVDSYDGRNYKAIFVTGELLGLLKIKQSGTIADYVAIDSQASWGDNVMTAGTAAAVKPIWQSVQYLQTFPNALPYPSYDVAKIIDAARARLGVRIGTLPANTLRVVPAELKPIDATTEIISLPLPNGAGEPMNKMILDERYFAEDEMPYSNQLTGECKQFVGYNELDVRRTVNYLEIAHDAEGEIKRVMKCVRSKFDMDVTFPDDPALDGLVMFIKPIEVAPVDIGQRYQQTNEVLTFGFVHEQVAYGSEHALLETFEVTGASGEFDTWDVVRTGGTAVRGETVHMERGKKYAFIWASDLASTEVYEWHDGNVEHARFDFKYDGNKNYERDGIREYRLRVGLRSADPVEHGTVYLQANLPQYTLPDMLKTVAYMYGRVLNYTDADGLTFETLSDMAQWQQIELDGKVIEQTDMSRRFGDYAQHNYVRFDSYKNIIDSERIVSDYEIENDNIASENELQVVPFSEGSYSAEKGRSFNAAIIINDDEQKTDKDTIMRAGAGDTYLGRVALMKNAAVQRLCDASTSVAVNVRMTLMEYESIKPKTILLYKGTRYVWNELQYKGNVVAIKMSKVG